MCIMDVPMYKLDIHVMLFENSYDFSAIVIVFVRHAQQFVFV